MNWLAASLIILSTLQIALADSTNAPPPSAVNPTNSTFLTFSATTNHPELAPPPFTTELSRRLAPVNLAPLEPKPNEIRIGNIRASGIAVEAAKTRNPLSLVNPFNPPANSSAEDNVVRDPFTGRSEGLSVFTIRF